jgi:hypothetical protein
MTDIYTEFDEFRLVGDDGVPVFYPSGWYDRYVELYAQFEAAKVAERDALQAARDRLELARLDYANAVANSPEVATLGEARDGLQEFRRWIHVQGYSFPHPSKLIPHQED